MNLRQKAKRYKKLYEQTLTQTVQSHIVTTEHPIVHLQTSSLIPVDELKIPGCREHYERIGQQKMIDELQQYISVSTEIENGEFGNYTRMLHDLWIVEN